MHKIKRVLAAAAGWSQAHSTLREKRARAEGRGRCSRPGKDRGFAVERALAGCFCSLLGSREG